MRGWQYSSVQYRRWQYSTENGSTVQYCTGRHGTVRQSTIQDDTIHYSNCIVTATYVMRTWIVSLHWHATCIEYISRKKRNNRQRAKNGNRMSQLKVAHWNIGAKLWQNKLLDIMALISDISPDILVISEANMWQGLPDHEKNIAGYTMVLPPTMSTLGHARLVMLIRDNIEVHRLDQFMEDDLAAVWVRVGRKGAKPLHIGGLYNEHRLLGQDRDGITNQDLQREQEERWTRMVSNWTRAGHGARCTAIGDYNLDYGTWDEPDQRHRIMVELTQNEVETKGHTQLINTITRTWRGQKDSVIDHVWTNAQDRVINHGNMVRAASDHNMIYVNISMTNMVQDSHNIKRRCWKNFDGVRFTNTMSQIDWSKVYQADNVNVAYSEFEDNVRRVLDIEAPMVIIQQRTMYQQWLTSMTKQEMVIRDHLREVARISQEEIDWQVYRKQRNKCTALQTKDRKSFLKMKYDRIEGKMTLLVYFPRQGHYWVGGKVAPLPVF